MQPRAEARRIDLRDMLVAGLAQARRATIATRNVQHFAGLSVPVIDGWNT